MDNTEQRINEITNLICKVDNYLTVMFKGLEDSKDYSCYCDVIEGARELAWKAHKELEALEKQLSEQAQQPVILSPEEISNICLN